MRRSVRLQTQGRARGPEQPAPRSRAPRPEKKHGNATEEARFLATLKEANMPAELVQTVQNNVSALDEAMEVLRSSGKRASKQEIRCVLIAANVAQRLKDPANAKKVLHPQSEAEVEIARDVAAALDDYALNSMESSERNQVEDLLYRYNLAIDTSRGLEYKCNFKPIFVPGVKTLTQSELESFLENNKVHHLAIFSVEREPEGMACFFVEDLFALLKTKSNSPTNADVHKFREEYWEMSSIHAGGVSLTAEDCMNALEWHAAYTQLKAIVEKGLSAEQHASLLKVSTAIVPLKRLGKWRRVGNFARYVVRSMWQLIGWKAVSDFFSNVMCVAVLTFGMFANPRMFTEAMRTTARAWCEGFLMCQLYELISYLMDQAGPYFAKIMDMCMSFLKKMGFANWAAYAGEWLEALKPQSQGSKAVVAGVKFVFSAFLKKLLVGGFLSGFTYVTGLTTGVSMALFSTWTIVPIAIGAVIVGYTTYKGKVEIPQALSYLDPNMGFIGVMLALLSSGMGCDVFGFVAGKKAARLCNSKLTSFAKSMNPSIVCTVCDMLLLLARVGYGDTQFLSEYFGETRCERLLSGLLEQDRRIVAATQDAINAAGKAFEIGKQIEKNNIKIEELINSEEKRGQVDSEISLLERNNEDLIKAQNQALNIVKEITSSIDFKNKAAKMLATFDAKNQTISSIAHRLANVNRMIVIAELEQKTQTSSFSYLEDLKQAQFILQNDLGQLAFIKRVHGTASDLKEIEIAQEVLAKADIASEKPEPRTNSSLKGLSLTVYRPPSNPRPRAPTRAPINAQNGTNGQNAMLNTTTELVKTLKLPFPTQIPDELTTVSLTPSVFTNGTSTDQRTDPIQNTSTNSSAFVREPAPSPEQSPAPSPPLSPAPSPAPNVEQSPPQNKPAILDEIFKVSFASRREEVGNRSFDWNTQGKRVCIQSSWTGDEYLVEKIIKQAKNDPAKAEAVGEKYHETESWIPRKLLGAPFLYFNEETCSYWKCD